MKTVINHYGSHIWFIVAFEEEFKSDKHNILYLEGAGKILAAMGTQWLIDNFSPDVIINIGTAGGNPNKNIEVGRIYPISKVIDRDYKIMNTVNPSIIINKENEANKCYTGDSFVEDWNNTDMEIVDMEAYAIAKVCNHPENATVFECYKFISDTGNNSQWEENLEKCNKAFNEMFKEI